MTKGISIEFEGFDEFNKKLKKLQKDAQSKTVIVGYTAEYSLWVHEMVDANFQRSGAEAKFLEKPFRRVKPDVVSMVKSSMDKGLNFGISLFQVGLFIQRESQKIVPIDTGNLKGSAFTRYET